MTKTVLLAVAAAAALLSQAPAYAADEATLTAAVFKEVETRSPDGHVALTRSPAARVTPGDQVVYVLTYRNGAAKPAENVVITNPVAADLVYAGPADGVAPTVSVDGQTFGPLASLTKRGAAGAAPATAADVTALRWRISDPVPAGGEVKLAFRARLK